MKDWLTTTSAGLPVNVRKNNMRPQFASESNPSLFRWMSSSVGAAFILATGVARAQQPVQPEAFSFDVYGDSRSMMYLPYTKAEEAQAHLLMVDMFDLVLPAKVSQEMVDKYVKLT